jgi:hypothetical protein
VSERSLVVRFGSLEALEAALVSTHDELMSRVEGTLERVDDELVGWSVHTDSRAAQLERSYRLREGAERLCAALEDVRAALAQVREDAHDAEVRNVAVIG